METPPSPLLAEYFYDGDGNMVMGVVNGVITYYPGRHYNEEVDNSVSTVKKFYTMGSTTVAVRTVSGTVDVLNWILGDHLGPTSVTANADGNWNSEIKYTAFGEVRASSGLTPTEYRYTNQRYENSLGLYFYVARWYDPALAHFAQADTIIPGAKDAKAYDRFAYVEWNPIRYSDPSGHAMCIDAECSNRQVHKLQDSARRYISLIESRFDNVEFIERSSIGIKDARTIYYALSNMNAQLWNNFDMTRDFKIIYERRTDGKWGGGIHTGQ